MRPKKTVIVGIAASAAMVLAAPGGAAAATDAKSVAARSCKVQQKNLGKTKFERKYGDHAMRACIQKSKREAAQAITSATNDCGDELALYGPLEFLDEYENATVESALQACIIEDVELELGLIEYVDDDGDED
jgi:hypothetical protein